MDAAHVAHSSLIQLGRRLLALLSLERIAVLFDVYQLFRPWLNHLRREGLYEILDYDSTLELLDPQGQTAIVKKRQQVKFNQDHIIAFQDYAWGDGDCLADYKCSPGVVVDRYQEGGDRWNLLISLRETKSRGDIEDFRIVRTVKQSFTKDDEWWQVEIRHPTKRLKMTVIFPRERRCQRAVLLQRSRHRATVLGPEHFSDLPEPDGRQMLVWETKNIRWFEIYTLKWRWKKGGR